MEAQAQVFDARVCTLGEGVFWHPLRRQLFWFDILGCRLLSRLGDQALEWRFDEHVSAAGWVDEDHLLIASESALFTFNLETGARVDLVALEADNPVTRSNDGRADPWGGFWIGTMGKAAEPGAGAIYRYFEGELVRLFDGITISNGICFSPDRAFAYFTDTLTQIIQRQALDGDGWPKGAPEPFIDLREARRFPDGAVVDAEGCIWSAHWGAWRVARYGPDGTYRDQIAFPAKQISCPGFGPDGVLYATSAAEGLDPDDAPHGATFAVACGVEGQEEPRVRLPQKL